VNALEGGEQSVHVECATVPQQRTDIAAGAVDRKSPTYFVVAEFQKAQLDMRYR